jgi:hypothetical protein
VELSKHGQAERIAVARLGGTAERHAYKGDALDLAAAVAELHAIATDPHLLAHAAAPHTDVEEVWPATATILQAAGAHLDEARAIWAHHLSIAGPRYARLPPPSPRERATRREL